MDSGFKKIYDGFSKKYRWIPLNGDIAGLCARTDIESEPWFSPAGYNRGNIKGVQKLSFNPSQGERDILYPKGINPVVTFPGEGTILFGDKTLQTKSSAFDRINVRRLFIILEKAISKASKYYLFELNDKYTRRNFIALIEPFLAMVKSRRGIDDFRVICDESNNTEEVVATNQFIADIYIKPLYSINYITLNFVAVKSVVQFTQIEG
jgi:phage tail sheath protein FI